MNIDTIKTYQTALNEALNRGTSIEKIKQLYMRLCEAKQRQNWLAEMQEQYETEHPEFQQGTKDDWDGEKKWEDLDDEEKENFKIKLNRPSFDEWLNETKEVEKTKAVINENGEEREETYTKLVPKHTFEFHNTACENGLKEILKQVRFRRLEKIFSQKTTGLKKIAIDKPWMTDPEAINQQYRVYEEMYKNAKAGYYDEATSQAIITANEATKQALAPVTLLLNNVRSIIQVMIENEDQSVDEKLDYTEAISLSREDLTQEKLQEIMEYFTAK